MGRVNLNVVPNSLAMYSVHIRGLPISFNSSIIGTTFWCSYTWKEMTSDLSLLVWIFLSPIAPLRQAVSGCEGRTSKAQSQTLLKRILDSSPIPNWPGSLYRSHNKILSSSLKSSRISWVNNLSLASSSLWPFAISLTISCPGLCFQPELWTPLTGKGCLPSLGKGLWQSSKRTKIGFILWSEQSERISFSRFLKLSLSCQSKSWR